MRTHSGSWIPASVLAVAAYSAALAIAQAPEPANNPATTARPVSPAIVATVNDEPITRETYVTALERQHGPEVLDQLVNIALLRQEAARCGAAQNEQLGAEIQQRVQQEVNRVLLDRAQAQGFPSVEEFGREYERARGAGTFAQLRVRLGEEARYFAEPQLLAEKILRQKIQVTDQQIADQFLIHYGPRVIAREIVVRTQADAESVLNKLKGGADFGLLAMEMSVDPVSRRSAGLMEPLPNKGPLAAAAFALKENETSNIIKTDEGLHILRLVRLIPARNVKLEDVKDELREEVVQSEIEKQIPELLAELRAKSKIEQTVK